MKCGLYLVLVFRMVSDPQLEDLSENLLLSVESLFVFGCAREDQVGMNTKYSFGYKQKTTTANHTYCFLFKNPFFTSRLTHVHYVPNHDLMESGSPLLAKPLTNPLRTLKHYNAINKYSSLRNHVIISSKIQQNVQ